MRTFTVELSFTHFAELQIQADSEEAARDLITDMFAGSMDAPEINGVFEVKDNA